MSGDLVHFLEKADEVGIAIDGMGGEGDVGGLGRDGRGGPGGVVEGDVGDGVLFYLLFENGEHGWGGVYGGDVGAMRGDEEAEVAGA